MDRKTLGILETYSLREQFSKAERKIISDKMLVHISLKEFEGKRVREVYGHGKGILVFQGTVNGVLPVLVKALQDVGYQGMQGAEYQSFTSKLLATLRSFDPTPTCNKCREPLLEGQLVTSIRTGHRHRIYHDSCYQGTFI